MLFTGSMSAKKYILALNCEERQQLEQVARSNHRSPREKLRARILLLADSQCSPQEGGSRKDEEIVQRLGCARVTVYRVRQRAAQLGALAAVAHQEQPKRKARALDGAQEAHLLALTCSAPPEGRSRWTLRLLRNRLIEMEVVEQVGTETIRRTLKKMSSSRG